MKKLRYSAVQKMTCFLLLVLLLATAAFGANATTLDDVQVTSAPLISSTTSRNGMVRVYLSSLGNPTVLNLTIRGNYTLSANGETIPYGSQVKVVFTPSSGNIAITYDGKTVNAGKKLTLQRHVRSGDNGLLIAQAYENQNLYPGDLSFEAVSDGSTYTMYTISHVYIEDYLYGVLPYEMSNSAGIEALKAQAVAARTYTVRMMQQRASGRYDVKDTTSDQVYRGTPNGNANCVSAVDATKGIVLMSGSDYVTTFYSATNGGQTEISRSGTRYAYMKVKDDPFDFANPNSPVKKQTVYRNLQSSSNPSSLISSLKTKVVSKLKSMGYSATADNTTLQTLTDVAAHTPIYASPSRLYTQMDFSLTANTRNGSGKTVSVPVTVTYQIFTELETLLGMSYQSSQNELWSVAESDSYFSIQVRRYGHGMGMSQRGAMYMATLGYTYDQILGFYFEGCSRVQQSFASTILGSNSNQSSSGSSTNSSCYGTVVLASGDANRFVLSAPNNSARINGIVKGGAKVDVYTNENGWCLIQYGDIVGYLPSDVLTISGTPSGANKQVTDALGFATVTSSGSLNMRASGSMNAAIMGTAPSGAMMTVFSTNGSWAKVQYAAKTAYVNTAYISAIQNVNGESNNTDSARTAYVVTENGIGTVNLRQSASLNANVVGQIPVGTTVSVLAEGDSWWRLSTNVGKGYMMSKFLRYTDAQPDNDDTDTAQLHATVVTQQGTLNVRALASLNSAVIATLSRGTKVVVLQKGEGWCNIRYNQTNGYVMTQYLSFENDNEMEETPSDSQDLMTAEVVTASGSLNLRNQPNANAAVVKQIPRGATVAVLEKETPWSRVSYLGSNGYVKSEFLRFSGEAESDSENNEPEGEQTLHAYVNTVSGALNMRKLPTLNAQLVTTVPRNARVTVLSKGNTWCFVRYIDIEGYVMTEYLRFDNEDAAENQNPSQQASVMWVFTQNGSLNMRSSASATASIKTTIPRLAQVKMIETQGVWSYVEYSSTRGYVKTEFLTANDPAWNTNDNADNQNTDSGKASAFTLLDTAIFEQQNTEGNPLVVIPANTDVELLLAGSEWCCVRYQGAVGYCLTNNLNVSYE